MEYAKREVQGGKQVFGDPAGTQGREISLDASSPMQEPTGWSGGGRPVGGSGPGEASQEKGAATSGTPDSGQAGGGSSQN